MVNLEQFKDVYAQFFPQGDAVEYSLFVFHTFDTDGNGQISFEELVKGLSILSRGTIDEKLEWIFRLYDLNEDGVLNKPEIETVVESVYKMMGKHTDPPINKAAIQNHADHVFHVSSIFDENARRTRTMLEDYFQKLDSKGYGNITLAQFKSACQEDKGVARSLSLFDTVINPTTS